MKPGTLVSGGLKRFASVGDAIAGGGSRTRRGRRRNSRHTSGASGANQIAALILFLCVVSVVVFASAREELALTATLAGGLLALGAVTDLAGGSGSGRIHFRVKLDRLGHLLIECSQGYEREETSLPGLRSLIANGFMREPGSLRIDPLQQFVEIDGVKYHCTASGAQELETALNCRYAPDPAAANSVPVEVKANLAANTGFDIHFRALHGGVASEIKGHLSQEILDILQDPAKCTLLRPGIQLRVSPPNLVFRRRRADGGEEGVPGIPDINYSRATPMQLQQALNHPAILRLGGDHDPSTERAAAEAPAEFVEIRLTRNPQNKSLLWMECLTAEGGVPQGKAFTHQNIADLQHAGVFRPGLDVCLSFDHRKLGILEVRTRHEQTIAIDTHSPDADLIEAGRMLTGALGPAAKLRPVETPAPVHGVPAEVVSGPVLETTGVARMETAAPLTAAPAPAQSGVAGPALENSPPLQFNAFVPVVPPEPAPDPAVLALFQETDPVRINVEIFAGLSRHFQIVPKDLCLSLPRIFENRRFEVIRFGGDEVDSVLQLRGEKFYGFYLTHIGPAKVVLVYACNGVHIEWGPDKCVLQPAITAEPIEYHHSALLGLAQGDNQFVFVVPAAFKDWVRPRRKAYSDQFVLFKTVADLATAPGNFAFIWPERRGTGPVARVA